MKDFPKKAKLLRKSKVKDMVSEGKNIYKDIRGFENEENYEVYDLKKAGLKNLVVSMTILWPGKICKEWKMTTGHSHQAEEVYIFLEGTGEIAIDKKKYRVKPNDIVTIPSNRWHRVINTGRKKLVFLSIFEKYPGR